MRNLFKELADLQYKAIKLDKAKHSFETFLKEDSKKDCEMANSWFNDRKRNLIFSLEELVRQLESLPELIEIEESKFLNEEPELITDRDCDNFIKTTKYEF